MSKENFELLRAKIRKTLDNTHEKDVLDYFKKGKITEQEKDALLDYLKMIDGIVVVAKNGVKKNKSEFKGYGEQSGWKIHLYVDPKNYQYVFRWLFLNGPYDFKHLDGGVHSEGTDFTIYIGGWDDLFDFAGILEKEIGDRLMKFDPEVNDHDICVYPHIAARFQLSNKIEKRDYVPGSPCKFHMYGWSGASFLWDDINALCELHGGTKGGMIHFAVTQKLWGWYKEVLAVRAYKELGRMFGDYFLGKRRPNLLTETFDKLERKYGSELPRPGRPCVADIANLTDKGFPYEDFRDVGNALIENKSFLRKEIFPPNPDAAWRVFLSALPVLMSTELASLLRNKDSVKVVLIQIKDVVSSRDIGLIAFIPDLLAWYLVELNAGRKPSSTRVKYLYEWYKAQQKHAKKSPSFKEVCDYAKRVA